MTKLFPHFIYFALIAAILVFVHSWQSEHDQRVLADATIKSANQSIVTLQQQITTTNAKAASDQAALERALKLVRTPAQAVAAIPQLTDAPLNARTVANDPVDVTVAALPLIQVLGQAKETSIQLGACQSDLKNETAISAEKDTEIAALKKKPKFWHRIGNTLKIAGVGFAIGLAVASHAL